LELELSFTFSKITWPSPKSSIFSVTKDQLLRGGFVTATVGADSTEDFESLPQEVRKKIVEGINASPMVFRKFISQR
jgi:hypothetical protein